MKSKRIAVVLLTIVFAGSAYGGILWSEDFDGYALGDVFAQDSSYSMSYTMTPEPTANINDAYPADAFGAGNQVLAVSKAANSASNHRGYAEKDLAGEMISPSETLISVDLDMFHRHTNGQYYGNINEFKILSSSGTIASLLVSDAGLGQRLNNVNIPGALWDYYAWRHYRFDIDFVSDTVALTIDGEASPRLTTSLDADYSATDITGLSFGAGMYFRNSRTGTSWIDNVVISEVPEPVTMTLLLLGGAVVLKRRNQRP